MEKPQLLIAAPHSGSGKTLVTLALLRHFKNAGMRVQPFKCGPDYLDTKLHSIAAGVLSYNLDLFMADAAAVRRRYVQEVSRANIAIVEGVMGMFDGYSGSKGSSAEVAKVLDIPIVLVVNAKAMAHSAAALLKGFSSYDAGVKIAGVIFNFVGSASHYEFLKNAAIEVGVEPLGWIAPLPQLAIESRHLGLQTENADKLDSICEAAASLLLQNVNLGRLTELTAVPAALVSCDISPQSPAIRIAIARDAAFSFVYPSNIEQLEREGSVTYFSPLSDSKLPEADFVYLPGGYPELHAEELARNHSMISSVRDYCDRGGAMLAECGGMIYLSKYITLSDGATYPLVGYFDFGTSMVNAKCMLGYRRVSLAGTEIRGHEFHYSHLEGDTSNSEAAVTTAAGRAASTKIFIKRRTLASYFHFFWGENGVSIVKLVDEVSKQSRMQNG